MDAEQTRTLVDGAAYLFSNEYELALIEQKTGWDAAEIGKHVEVQATTLAADGARITQAGAAPGHGGRHPRRAGGRPDRGRRCVRAGFLAAVAWQLPLERAGQLGCLVAASALETVGTQEYELTRATLTDRFAAAYGAKAASEVADHLV